jgi:FtsZ-binding cell division protein ZapB
MSDEIINQLTERIQRLKDGYEGCCTACEPVGEMNQKLRQEVEQLRKERDEARRRYCVMLASVPDPLYTTMTAEDYAAENGWDCFKEDTND